ncbi:cytochrome o ubiquinol oxidase subunit II [Candidatus Fukatsuia symbiotica]|uniref:Ubiquinol oxidase subunit 2 n=1 Tax=Candidatus Fukatsuia symbiotica TaxID=1878942 RepID=A0A2U8I2W4_9GAMM|nr:cytochrome o ubiquinol oxidase subunit II [Candidatus Fukatsuia symbiotica]AWK13453.1 cytochrome o ubiquinol oxidase subunit II [Candidatus Fukatsuia symbiotica]MEA9444347.1 cytochrome o ubiquinol oxidase subunit II [Candidatus Fukatsuia symbiotica]
MRRKSYIKSIGIFSLFAAMVMLSGCDTVLMDPKGAIGVEQKKLILTATGLMLIVVIPVIFMTFAFAWKFRASNKNAAYTPNWSHSNKIEVVVWSVPIIIIAILAVITWRTSHELDPYKPLVSDKKPITIEVISLDWKWLFIYPEQGIATVNELAFPTHVPLNFKITSNSVMNSFFIPQLGGQIYAMAGMQTKLHLIANEAGKYKGISGSYSGEGFSGMKFTAIATPTEADFNRWVAQVKASPHTLNNTDDFDKLAQPSENNPVDYFSSVKPALFKETINKFMGDMHMHSSEPMGDKMHQSIHKGEQVHTGTEE